VKKKSDLASKIAASNREYLEQSSEKKRDSRREVTPGQPGSMKSSSSKRDLGKERK